MASRASLALALSVLESFKENGSYSDYQKADGWTDAQYEEMLNELRRATKPAKAFEKFMAEHPDGIRDKQPRNV